MPLGRSGEENMDYFEIVIADTPFEMWIRPETSTLIDSIIFFRTDHGTFPCDDWTDFSLDLLSMWCEALIRMPTWENTICTLCFMDGPYRMEVRKQGEVYVFEAKWDKKDYQGDFGESFIFHCSLEEFLAEILRAFRQMIEILYQKQADESVRNEVKEIYQHYKKVVAQYLQETQESGSSR